MINSPLRLSAITRPSSLKGKAPALFLLHGYGSDENDLFSFAEELPKELFIISLRAPHPLSTYGNAWYAIDFDADQNKWNNIEQAKSSMKLILEYIESSCKIYNLDSNNINLLGFSQGCILSMALAMNYPKIFKNIIGLSGYICKEFLTPPLDRAHYKHLSFYCSHGSSDQVIPVEWARETPKLLEQYHIAFDYSEFPVGHGVSPQNFFEFKQWLENRI